MDKIGVGIIGTGFGVHVQLPGFAAHPDFQVVAVTSGTPGRASAIAGEHGIPHAFEDWRQLVAHPQVRLVSVASTTDRHAEGVLAALAAGKAVLCEKPMGMDVAETRAMLAAASPRGDNETARDAGAVAAIDFLWRHRPAETELKRRMESGALGELRHVDWTITWPGLPSWAQPMSWSWQARRGGGMLGNVGSHWLDQLLWCFGPASRVSAHLVSHFPTRAWPDGTTGEVDTEDAFTVMLRFAAGGTGILRFFAAGHHSPGSRLEAYGSEGTVVIENDDQLSAGAAGQPLETVPLPAFRVEAVAHEAHEALGRYAPFLAVVDRLARRLRGEEVCDLATFADGSRVQAVMDAARRSHADGRWVAVEAHETA